MLEDIPYPIGVTESPLKKEIDDSILNESGDRRSLYLSELTLHPNAAGFFNQFRGRFENVHYITLSWDYSALSPTGYPYLNFKCNKLPLEIMAAETHHFTGDGMTIFPEKKVVDSLNACLFFFKNRKVENTVDDILEHVERIVNNSHLRQELSKMTFDSTHPEKEKLSKLAELLYLDIEDFLCTMKKLKHLSTVNCKYDLNQNWKIYDEQVIEKDLVRITLKKRKY